MRVKSQRIVIPGRTKEYSETKTCRAGSCRGTTWEGKPYCLDHVKRHPYVQQLLTRLENRIIEDERIRKLGSCAVDVDNPGITLKEIIRILKANKIRTEERLERDLQLPMNLIHSYCVALQKRGMVKIKMKSCGRQQVTLLS